jgi:hypothetical protein
VRAQHTVDPVIGFLSSVDPASLERAVSAFHQGLDHTGFIEARNVTVTYKWAEHVAFERIETLGPCNV